MGWVEKIVITTFVHIACRTVCERICIWFIFDRVYPELDLKKLSVLPMSEAEMLRLNQGVLLQQRERLEDTFIEMYSEERFTISNFETVIVKHQICEKRYEVKTVL